MSKRMLMAGAAALLALVLSGCQGEEPAMTTLDEAKAEYFEVQDEIRALIPQDIVVEDLGANEEATLLPCEANRDEFTWPGAAAVRVDASTDTAAVIDAIAREWEGREDWSMARPEATVLELTRDDGLWMAVATREGNTQLHISGFSVCFPLDNHDPFEKY